MTSQYTKDLESEQPSSQTVKLGTSLPPTPPFIMLAWLGCDSQFNNTPGANQSQRAGPAPTAPTAAALIPPRPHPVRGRHSGPPSPQPSLGPNITCRGNAAILRGKCYAQIRSKNNECGGGPTRYVVCSFQRMGTEAARFA